MVKFWNCALEFPRFATCGAKTPVVEKAVEIAECVLWHCELKCLGTVQRKFSTEFGRESPTKLCGYKWNFFSEAGCFRKGKGYCKRLVTEGKVNKIWAVLIVKNDRANCQTGERRQCTKFCKFFAASSSCPETGCPVVLHDFTPFFYQSVR